jgi:hypothetical protein
VASRINIASVFDALALLVRSKLNAAERTAHPGASNTAPFQRPRALTSRPSEFKCRREEGARRTKSGLCAQYEVEVLSGKTGGGDGMQSERKGEGRKRMPQRDEGARADCRMLASVRRARRMLKRRTKRSRERRTKHSREFARGRSRTSGRWGTDGWSPKGRSRKQRWRLMDNDRSFVYWPRSLPST